MAESWDCGNISNDPAADRWANEVEGYKTPSKSLEWGNTPVSSTWGDEDDGRLSVSSFKHKQPNKGFNSVSTTYISSTSKPLEWGNTPASSTWGDEDDDRLSVSSFKYDQPNKGSNNKMPKEKPYISSTTDDDEDILHMAMDRKLPYRRSDTEGPANSRGRYASNQRRRGGGNQSDRGGGHQSDRGGGHQSDRGGGHQSDRGGGHQSDRGGGYQSDRGGGYQSDRGGGYQSDRGGGYQSDRGGRYNSNRGGRYNSDRGNRNFSEKNSGCQSGRGGGYQSSSDNNKSELDKWGRKKKPRDYQNDYTRQQGRSGYRNNTRDSDGYSGRNNSSSNSFKGQNNLNKPRNYNTDSDNPNYQRRDNDYKSQPHSQRNKGANQNENPNKASDRPIYKMTDYKMKALLEKPHEPNELMLTLKSEKSGFTELLKEHTLSSGTVANILELLEEACKSTQKLNLLQLIGIVNDSNFLIRHIPDYLFDLEMEHDVRNERLLDSLKYLVNLLIVLPDFQPAIATKMISSILPRLSNCIDNLIKEDLFNDYSILDSIGQLEIIFEELRKKYKDKDLKKHITTEKQHATKPPESFYNLHIFPTQEELNSTEKPYLKCNITEGHYVNVESYLDTQFRLMREDFVRPLREGIMEYQIERNVKKVKKIQGLYIYYDVHVMQPVCSIDGINHIVNFDVQYFKHVDWESSKRFFPGSLVCLSSDNFKTILFATVAKRDTHYLRKGILYIHFEEKNDYVKKIIPTESYVMIESSAFFEAYYHNLVAMQELDEDNFPLKDYIVYVKPELKPPKYLEEAGNAVYDIRPLMCPFPEKKPPSKDFFNEDKISNNRDIYTFTPLMEYVSEIHILEEEAWPPYYELGLDEYQLKALQLALTKEFVMIQGPPGTGKTYIGLRIVQLLLYNSHFWTSSNDAPILIVCFTNHALDQFLEGLLHFTRSLIRIGGRCTSEELADYRIAKKRRELKDSNRVPPHIHSNRTEVGKKLNFLQSKIDIADKNISTALQDVLEDEDLREIMDETHFESLVKNGPRPNENDGKLLLDWLGLRMKGSYSLDDQDDSGSDDESEMEILPSRLPRETSIPEIVDEPKLKDDDNDNEDYEKEDFFEDPAGYLEDLDDLEEMRKEMNLFKSEDRPRDNDSNPESKIVLKKRKTTVQNKIKTKNSMEESEVKKVKNIWALNDDLRWKLYIYWIKKFIAVNYENIYEFQGKYEDNLKLLKELRIQEDLYIIKGCKIVGMTTTGAAKNQNLLAELQPKIVIVEEAAEVSEAHIITALNKNTQQLILIGDHQQLRPSQASFSLAVEHNIDISLFERMVNNKMYFQQLVSQHRMRPCIASLLVPTIYKVLKNSRSVHNYEPVKGVAHNMYFITHRFMETQEKDSVSRINLHEASFVAKLAKYFSNQGYKKKEITVLTTYSAQVFQITRLMKIEDLEEVQVKSVDNYQGEENEIIIISFVRSNVKAQVGFLKVANRVCVALSRARKGLFCIGNFDMLASDSTLWKDIVEKLDTGRVIGPDLKLICQIHPDTFVEVRNAVEFSSKVPEGGCTRSCGSRLECGHTCPRRCHPYDAKHEFIQCKEICNKKTCKEHRCPKRCFQCKGKEGCGKCVVHVEKDLPCGHTCRVPCSKPPKDERCRQVCGKILVCGHACDKYCFETCEICCNQMVDKIGACGHAIKIVCHKSKDRFELLKSCTAKCEVELRCGHFCKGRCGLCSQGTLHQTCKTKCNRALVCGHECSEPCSRACPPCSERCQYKCSHNKCPKLCGIPCEPCSMKCTWQCPHKKCKKPCGETCDRTPCTRPCPNLIDKCKHKCIGFCGEKCPVLCLICHKETLTTMFFGFEDKIDARFVELECGCIFESTGLDTFATKQTEVDNVIRMLRCPRCQKVIRNSNFLGKYVKNITQKIEIVKEKVYGMKKENKRKQKNLRLVGTNLLQRLEALSSSYNFRDILRAVNTVLGDENLDVGKLTAMENFLKFIKRMNKMDEDLWEASDNILNHTAVFDLTLQDHLIHLRNRVSNFMIESCKSYPTQQQMEDISSELDRLEFIGNFVISVHKGGGISELDRNEVAKKQYKSGLVYLLAPKPIDENTWPKIKAFSMELRKQFKLAAINLSEGEKQAILKAVGLSQGHWYQCPNGHVYCIGECGGAMELSRCNECGSKIGGLNHVLQTGNYVASEMDGAEESVWS